jgi:hypothetical protein
MVHKTGINKPTYIDSKGTLAPDRAACEGIKGLVIDKTQDFQTTTRWLNVTCTDCLKFLPSPFEVNQDGTVSRVDKENSFIKHLNRVSREVATWPKWKRELIGKKRTKKARKKEEDSNG